MASNNAAQQQGPAAMQRPAAGQPGVRPTEPVRFPRLARSVHRREHGERPLDDAGDGRIHDAQEAGDGVRRILGKSVLIIRWP